MPVRLLVALVLLVAAPLVLLGWISGSAVRQQQDDARAQLIGFFESRLAEIDRDLSEIFRGYERQLRAELLQAGATPQTLSRIDRQLPIVRATLYVDRRGTLVYPDRPWPEDTQQVALYAALPAMVGSRPELRQIDDSSSDERATTKGKMTPAVTTRQDPAVSTNGVWQTWYMDEGLQLICWFSINDGASVGVLLERARWMSDLTATLPDAPIDQPRMTSPDVQTGSTAVASDLPSGATVLSDEIHRLIYRWGNNNVSLDSPLAIHSLSSPLSSWRLEYYTRDPLIASTTTPLVLSLLGIGIMLLSLGGYVLTSVQRQIRTARSRVSFASQVSHELRTPLTNIRLYAELAEDDLSRLVETDRNEVHESLSRRLKVIDTESRRLTRLVSGVLELIRDPHKQRQPRLQHAVPDELIEQVLLQFEPSFQQLEITVQTNLQTDRKVMIDIDIVELILVNLLSNVEKYAAAGKRVLVQSRFQLSQDGEQLVVDIADWGEGIASRLSEKIFRPFWRGDDSVDAPSGTGIGLTIARRLAARHGGQLELIDRTQATSANELADQPTGAWFQMRLPLSEHRVPKAN